MPSYHCELAWLGGDRATADVVVDVEGDRITGVRPGRPAPPGAVQLPGLTLPGFANAHSHAFHRALRGRTHRGTGSFWTWRQQMYAVAATLDPDRYHALARATYGEMALAGISAVGEFHYLHHGPDGVPYADPNAMSEAVLAAASDAGIRITLLDACYLRGGPGVDLDPVQRRFSDGTVEHWAARVDRLRPGPHAAIGAAVHSTRAVAPDDIAVVAAWAAARAVPLHAHVSEQPAENEHVLAAHGATPVGLLAAAGALGERFTAVHATHLTPGDVSVLGATRCSCCICPTTERDLADGIGPTIALRDAGARLTLGSDSQAVIDMLEEARAVELDERLASLQRGRHEPPALLRMATGHAGIGWPDAGRIVVGALADLTSVRLDSVRTAGIGPHDAVAGALFAATATDVHHVVVGGRVVVRDGCHVSIDVAAELRRALVLTTVVTGIGRLVTNTERGELSDVWLVMDGADIIDLGTGPAPAADRAVDVTGRCVIPGFVDSHTHLVFAGDRAAEFAARMAGAPYAAGGINTTIAATRAASDAELRTLAAARREEARRAGITTIEVKSGYGATVDDEARLVRLAAELTPDATFLGAHVVPAGVAADAYVELVCSDMLAAAAPHARWIDAFCEVGAFDADQCRAVLTAGRTAGLGLRLHANQLGPGPGVQLAVELGCASADHCTYLTDDDVEALAASATVATFLPATDFSTRQPYPDARRVIDAGATVALATNCNPGSSYTTSMSFVIALAVRELHMTAAEALRAATLGGARSLQRDDVGWLGPGSRADLVVIDAPGYEHLVYRPGVPLIHDTIIGGAVDGHDTP